MKIKNFLHLSNNKRSLFSEKLTFLSDFVDSEQTTLLDFANTYVHDTSKEVLEWLNVNKATDEETLYLNLTNDEPLFAEILYYSFLYKRCGNKTYLLRFNSCYENLENIGKDKKKVNCEELLNILPILGCLTFTLSFVYTIIVNLLGVING